MKSKFEQRVGSTLDRAFDWWTDYGLCLPLTLAQGRAWWVRIVAMVVCVPWGLLMIAPTLCVLFPIMLVELFIDLGERG